MPNILKRIEAAYKAYWGGGDWVASSSNSLSAIGRFQWDPGTALNYQAIVGDIWTNSAVQACINWLWRAWPESYPCIKEMIKGEKVEVAAHPLLDLLMAPNSFDDDTSLWAATILSYWCDGNAYWGINRDGLGRPAELVYIPHANIQPKREQGSVNPGPDFYLLGVKQDRIPVSDIVHFRFGKDPYNDMKGLSAWAAANREIYTDNEACNYAASTLRNRGSAWMIVSPDGEMEIADPKAMKTHIVQETTGDKRSGVLVFDQKVKVDLPPSVRDQDLGTLRKYPETRICSMAGLPAMAVGLEAGLERSTFSNTEQATTAAWHTIVAVQRMMGRQLTRQMLRDPKNFMDAKQTLFAGFDYSEVRALQPNKIEVDAATAKVFQANIITRDEARLQMGMEPIDGTSTSAVNVFYSDTQPVPIAPGPNDPNALPTDEKPAKGLPMAEVLALISSANEQSLKMLSGGTLPCEDDEE